MAQNNEKKGGLSTSKNYFTSVIQSFEKKQKTGEWKLRNLTIDENVVTISDAKTKIVKNTFDISVFKDPYSAVQQFDMLLADQMFLYPGPLYPFTLTMPNDDFKIPGLPNGCINLIIL